MHCKDKHSPLNNGLIVVSLTIRSQVGPRAASIMVFHSRDIPADVKGEAGANGEAAIRC